MAEVVDVNPYSTDMYVEPFTIMRCKFSRLRKNIEIIPPVTRPNLYLRSSGLKRT